MTKLWSLAAAVVILSSPAAAQQRSVIDMMKASVDPASKAFWAGGNDPPENETPAQASARWIAAAKGAETLQAAAAELASPAMTRPGAWNDYAKAMADAVKAGAPAMAAHDLDKAFEAGGQLYEACAGCHKVYAKPRE